MSIPDGEDGTEDGGGCEVGVAGGAAVAIRYPPEAAASSRGDLATLQG